MSFIADIAPGVEPASSFGRALVHWAGNGYHDFAPTMRALDADGTLAAAAVTPQWRSACRVLARGIYSGPTIGRALTVYSGLGKTAGKRLLEAPATATLRLAAATSTTIDPVIAADFARRQSDGRRYAFCIQLPPEARAVFLETREKEWLLPPGTRLELTGDSTDVEVEVERYDPEGDAYISRRELTLVLAKVVGQRLPSWVR